MALFGLSGVHAPHRKNTASSKPVRMPSPKTVVIPLSQHIGAPASVCVAVGDTVGIGQPIGEASGYVSAPVHASVSGTVKSVGPILGSNGSPITAVTIESDEMMTSWDGIKKPSPQSFDDFIKGVRDSGLVGMGGAGFPASVKLNVKDLSKIDEIILNGAECEPYITSDTLCMTERADDILGGIRLLKKWLQVKKVYIGIEDNKPLAIEKMNEIAKKEDYIEVKSLPALYPQGGEKVLIYNITGKVVPEGKLPLDVGSIVMNVTSCASLFQYFETGMPIVEKCITVDGSAIKNPMNVIAPVGTMVSEIIDFTGGFKEDPYKVLFGGPMMGIAMPDLNQPVTKTCNAIIAFNEKDSRRPKETACIHCANCINHCPFRLNPPAIEKALNQKDWEGLKKLHVNVCMECGCCSFICPARRDIVARNKLAKQGLRQYEMDKKAKEAQNNG